MRFVISGGGTGGHIYPALAVAQALRELRPGVELAYVGGARGFERQLVGEAGEMPYHQLAVRSLLRSARRTLSLTRAPGRRGPGSLSAHGPPSTGALFNTVCYLAIPLLPRPGVRGIPHRVGLATYTRPVNAAVGRLATRLSCRFPRPRGVREACPRDGTPFDPDRGDREAARAICESAPRTLRCWSRRFACRPGLTAALASPSPRGLGGPSPAVEAGNGRRHAAVTSPEARRDRYRRDRS